MHYSSTIFSQLLDFLPKAKFKKFVGQHKTDRYVKKLSAWNHLVILLYAQAAGKESLREIETGLSLETGVWHHLGIKTVSRSSLGRVNNKRDPKVFEKLFYALLEEFQDMTSERKFSFENPLYSLDSTLINLCLNIFGWAKYQKRRGAFKIHTLLDNRMGIPVFLEVTEGNISDIKKGKAMNFFLSPGSILVFDRGYIDYLWWKELEEKGIFFVTRAKENMNILVSRKRETKGERVKADENVWVGDVLKDIYGKELRRVIYLDPKQGELVFLTNNFSLKAEEIALIYKDRWQIELFFKWIKQNLKIKSFLGTSRNAVLNQIWTAMIYYLLLSYIRFQTRSKKSLLEFTWMVGSTFLRRRPLIDLLSLSPKTIFKFKDREFLQESLF